MEDISGKLILITGGARSGKSTFAERYAAAGDKKVIYIATAAGDDEEMRRRIAGHRKRRPPQFDTVEEPFYPHRILEKGKKGNLFLLDCLTLLLTNHLLKKGEKEEEGPSFWFEQATATLQYIELLMESVGRCPADIMIVTNEVGMGLVPENKLGRIFRDLAGKANQIVATEADEVWLMVCGIAQQIK
ncbi:MAG: bifunctional adenosylcobinamide kinase/adenosylcobinamide-phosphate guanylyltransferase [Firmicutes bacterium]|nr:bifunctional adenosylcobinamide kinase/adenosylcobinamide-phosphate guanylyltransferase [Bacillota bacterium]